MTLTQIVLPFRYIVHLNVKDTNFYKELKKKKQLSIFKCTYHNRLGQ